MTFAGVSVSASWRYHAPDPPVLHRPTERSSSRRPVHSKSPTYRCFSHGNYEAQDTECWNGNRQETSGGGDQCESESSMSCDCVKIAGKKNKMPLPPWY